MAAVKQGNVPVKSAEQRAKLRARSAVRRHGMDYRPKARATK